MNALSWKTLALVFCILVLVQEVTSVDAGCIERSLVGNNNLSIPDSSFTASSYLYDSRRSEGKTPDDRYVPSNARLNGNYGWSPRTNNDPNDYLQIDLGAVRVITAVATQGNGGIPGRTPYNEWITEYKLQFKKDTNSKWVKYKDTIFINKLNKGSINSNTVVRYNFTNYHQTARYIKFIPVDYHEFKTMRANVYVIEQVTLRVQTATPFERSILLSWTLTCIKTRPRFIVNVTKKGEFNVGRVTSYNITGLQPYTDYEIRVKAVEYELWSQTMTIKTTVAVPEVSPTIISNVSNSSTSIVLEWKLNKTKLLHGPLTGYRITSAAQGGSTKTVDVGAVNTGTLTSLNKYTLYTITVSVKNTKYVGPSSRKVETRTIEDVPEVSPTIISNVSNSSTSIVLEWKQENTQLLNGPLTGYKITYTAQGGSTRTADVGVVNTWVLTSLKKSTWYTITVSVKNTKYVGPPSRKVEIRTMGDDSGGKDHSKDRKKSECSSEVTSYILAAVIVILIVVIVLLLIYVQRLRKQLHGTRIPNERHPKEIPITDETVLESTNVTRPREAIAMTDVNPEYEHIDEFQKSPKILPLQQQPIIDPSSVHTKIVSSSQQQSDYQSLDKSTKDGDVYEELQPETRTANPRNEDIDRTTYQSLTNAAVELQPSYEDLHMYGNTKSGVQI